MKKKNYTNWFPHEPNPENNRQLKAMRTAYGMQGYGCWWVLQEILSTQPGYKLDISHEYAMNDLADDMRMDAAFTEQFINDCVTKFKLLECDDTHLWCPYLMALLQPLEEKRAFLSECGKKGVEKKKEKKLKAEENERVAEGVLDVLEAQNKTKENKTEEKKTTENNNAVDDDTSVNTKTIITNTQTILPANPYADMTLMMQRALSDNEFTYITMQSFGVDAEKLQLWMEAFNRKLAFEADTIKNDKEYRRHFTNWLKYRNVKQEDPNTYTPVTTGLPPGKQKAAVVPLEMPRKNVKTLLEERRLEEEEWLKKSS
ncbi:MAG: DUF4373 domain-containing protein [Bacteroidetes bacterium]|nr:DUF4373 domain-containing protein [Bacteroidota bacterium]